MNTRILGSGIRLLRACSSRRLPIQFIYSSVPRSFSSLSSRLYASITFIQSSIVYLGNVKRYTEQHEWIEIGGDDIGRSDNCDIGNNQVLSGLLTMLSNCLGMSSLS